MWLPGHLAVALLICLPLLILYRVKQGNYMLALAFIAFFSVLPDFLHFDTGLRTFSHSLLGAALLTAVILLIIWKVLGLNLILAVTAIFAVFAHLLADLFIGHIYPWYPFSTEYVQNNQFNTVFDLRAEVVLSIFAWVMILALLALDRKGFRLEVLPIQSLRTMLTLLLTFAALCFAQMGYFGIQDIIQNFTWSAAILGLFFLALLFISFAWAIGTYHLLRNGIVQSSEESRHYQF